MLDRDHARTYGSTQAVLALSDAIMLSISPRIRTRAGLQAAQGVLTEVTTKRDGQELATLTLRCDCLNLQLTVAKMEGRREAKHTLQDELDQCISDLAKRRAAGKKRRGGGGGVEGGGGGVDEADGLEIMPPVRRG